MFSEVDGAVGPSGVRPDLVATWEKFWVSHLLFYHEGGDYFNVYMPKLFSAPFPDADDDDGKPFLAATEKCSRKIKVNYIRGSDGVLRVEGLALKGFWGPGVEAIELSGEDRENAEVWLARV